MSTDFNSQSQQARYDNVAEYFNWNKSISSPGAFDRGLILRDAITPFQREAKYKLWSGGGVRRQTDPNPLREENRAEFLNTSLHSPHGR